MITADGRFYLAGLFGEDGLAMLDLWDLQAGVSRVLNGYGRGQEKLPVYKMPHLEGWAATGNELLVPAVGRHEVLVVDQKDWKESGRIAVHGQPVFVVARPDNRQVWVNFAFPNNDTVQVIDVPAHHCQNAEARQGCVAHGIHSARRAGVGVATRREPGGNLRSSLFAKVGEIRADSPSGIFSDTTRAPDGIVMTEAIEFHLLNDYQRDFPLVPTPFAAIAHKLGITEQLCWIPCASCRCVVSVSRVGAVFRPHRVGYSTLAAMAVPEDQLEEAAQMVNSVPPSITTTSANTPTTCGLW